MERELWNKELTKFETCSLIAQRAKDLRNGEAPRILLGSIDDTSKIAEIEFKLGHLSDYKMIRVFPDGEKIEVPGKRGTIESIL
jgi:DNA-directed RNA polymerase subunit K/omega